MVEPLHRRSSVVLFRLRMLPDCVYGDRRAPRACGRRGGISSAMADPARDRAVEWVRGVDRDMPQRALFDDLAATGLGSCSRFGISPSDFTARPWWIMSALRCGRVRSRVIWDRTARGNRRP